MICSVCKADKHPQLFSPGQRKAEGYRRCIECRRKQTKAYSAKTDRRPGDAWRQSDRLFFPGGK